MSEIPFRNVRMCVYMFANEYISSYFSANFLCFFVSFSSDYTALFDNNIFPKTVCVEPVSLLSIYLTLIILLLYISSIPPFIEFSYFQPFWPPRAVQFVQWLKQIQAIMSVVFTYQYCIIRLTEMSKTFVTQPISVAHSNNKVLP